MVNLKIDGQEVAVPEGTTVLRAAQAAGINIPTLCDQKELAPYGGCRLCLVEVEGARTLQPSCTLPASNGMVVLTNTPKVRDARKFVLTLIFSERNHFCMYCPVSGGDCELQNSAYGEGMTHWPLQPNWQPFPMDASHEDFVLDNNRCILCRRCIRACGELVGNFTLGVEERGASTLVIADLGVPLGESTCIGCGTCIQVCPTGSLLERAGVYQGREKDITRVKTTCPGCSVGCGVEMIVRDNRLVRVEGDWAAPVNNGLLCQIGRFQPMKEISVRERIVTPMVRKDGALKAATWDEALDSIAGKLKPLAGKNGTGIAAVSSPRMTAEALHGFEQLFGAGLGSPMVTSLEPQTATPLTAGALDALKAADCVIVAGADLVADHQVAGFFIKRNLPKGAKLIVVDNTVTAMTELADKALIAPKGAEAQTLAGLMADPSVAKLMSGASKPVVVVGKSAYWEAAVKLAEALKATVINVQGGANSMAAAAYKLDKSFEPKGRQAVYVALGDAQTTPAMAQQLEGAPFIAVQASYVSQVTAMADVVLPVEMWAEQEGHYMNLEGTWQEAHRGINAPAEIWSNAKVFEALAERIGAKLDGHWNLN
ncbi:MAG TPA: molybdopterin-dependent oxidoreductase [Anaerolineae bacterium]